MPRATPSPKRPAGEAAGGGGEAGGNDGVAGIDIGGGTADEYVLCDGRGSTGEYADFLDIDAFRKPRRADAETLRLADFCQ